MGNVIMIPVARRGRIETKQGTGVFGVFWIPVARRGRIETHLYQDIKV